MSKCLKGILGKFKVITAGIITMDDLSKSKAYPCGICSSRVKANSVLLCVQCGKWIH